MFYLHRKIFTVFCIWWWFQNCSSLLFAKLCRFILYFILVISLAKQSILSTITWERCYWNWKRFVLIWLSICEHSRSSIKYQILNYSTGVVEFKQMTTLFHKTFHWLRNSRLGWEWRQGKCSWITLFFTNRMPHSVDSPVAGWTVSF